MLIHSTVDSYRAKAITVPRDIYKGSSVGFNKIVDNMRDSKVDVEGKEFARWRVARDAPDDRWRSGTGTPAAALRVARQARGRPRRL